MCVDAWMLGGVDEGMGGVLRNHLGLCSCLTIRSYGYPSWNASKEKEVGSHDGHKSDHDFLFQKMGTQDLLF